LRPDELTYTEELAEKKRRGKAKARTTASAFNLEKKGNLLNVRISADPFTIPNLIKRFYRIPERLIKWGRENILEIRLYGDYATGISEPVFIRKASSEKQKKAIIEFDNTGAYLKDIGQVPQIKLNAEVCYAKPTITINKEKKLNIRIENNTEQLAFFVNIYIKGLDNEIILIWSDNYFSLLPGKRKEITLRIINHKHFKGKKKIRFIIRGWNVKTEHIGKGLEIDNQ